MRAIGCFQMVVMATLMGGVLLTGAVAAESSPFAVVDMDALSECILYYALFRNNTEPVSHIGRKLSEVAKEIKDGKVSNDEIKAIFKIPKKPAG